MPTVRGALPLPPGTPLGCAGVGLTSVLHGDPGDPRLAWLTPFEGVGRTDVVWPIGYSARFAPALEVLDETGRVVLREGDFVDGACGVDGAGALELQPPFAGFALSCGPMPVNACTDSGRLFAIEQDLGSRFPSRDVAGVGFTTSNGAYEITFEDGGRATGP